MIADNELKNHDIDKNNGSSDKRATLQNGESGTRKYIYIIQSTHKVPRQIACAEL